MAVLKIEKPKAAIHAVLNCQSVPVRDIARITSYLISMTIALGPAARVFIRHICILSLCIEGLGTLLCICFEATAQELKFWLQCVYAFNGYHIKRKFCTTGAVYSDATDCFFVNEHFFFFLSRYYVHLCFSLCV